MDGKPISQMFADELDNLIKRFVDSGLENSQAIGVLDMKKFDIMSDIREELIRKERPF